TVPRREARQPRCDGRLMNRTGSTLPDHHPTAVLTSVKRSADRAGLTGCTAFRVMTPQNGIEPTEALLFQNHATSRPEHAFRAAMASSWTSHSSGATSVALVT